MNREHLPCGRCARFIPEGKRKHDEDGPGHCEGFERPAHSTDQPCVLFNEQGAWETRKAQQPANTIKPRASAPPKSNRRETTCKT